MRIIYRIFFFLLTLLFCLNTRAQSTGSAGKENYFESPLEIPLILSGTFGELRSNHFHGGLDIKTHQRIGLNVLASASGYVSRIKISHFGYGKAIYIKHPNGLTTVYGHLNKFAPHIQKYIRKIQYEKEQYEVEVFPKANELPVEQGELIALSGNSGGSGGPHLHFEIRDEAQKPMNALNYGFTFPDDHAPLLEGLYAYTLDENAHVESQQGRIQLRPIHQGNHRYTTEPIQAFGKIGFGVISRDLLNNAHNKNGVYKIQTFLNGEELFTASFDTFSFSESRYINRFIDYEFYKSDKKKIQKLFIEENNPLSILAHTGNKGYIELEGELDYNYKVLITDFANNTTEITVPIQSKKKDKQEIKTVYPTKTDYLVKANHAIAFDEGIYDIYIPKNALYEDTYLDIKAEEDYIKIHNDQTPLHKNFTLGIDVSGYKNEDKEKMYIARLTDWGKAYYVKTYKKPNRFTIRTRTFGKYTLKQDWEGPKIEPVNFVHKKWMSKEEVLQFKIEDELTNIQAYRATVNGKFILMEYDYKTNMLTHYFEDGAVVDTENHLQLIVIDNVGNSTTFEGIFYRKTKS